MRHLRKWSACLLVAVSLPLVACREQTNPMPEPIPPGVSVDPPRRAAETGGLAVPGREPADREAAATQEPALTDTVTPPAQRPNQ
jgi:hypothetical protein